MTGISHRIYIYFDNLLTIMFLRLAKNSKEIKAFNDN